MSELGPLLLAHLRLVAAALALATLIGAAAGAMAARSRWAERIALGSSSLVQTVPAIALLAVMVPTLAWAGRVSGVSLPSIGALPALIALTAYALLPIVRGVVLGIAGIEPAIQQAARAVGMTDRERLVLVELPLAAPSILAGIRTAAVWTVGMATLGTPVGAASLGNLIFAGLQTRHYEQVLLGCGGAALLAIVIDGLLALAERAARGRDAMRALSITALALATSGIFALASDASSAALSTRAIRVGAKPFTESLVLAEILACVIDEPVEIRGSLGSTVAFDALSAGDLDAYVEYSGTAWTTILGRDPGDVERGRMLAELAPVLEREHHVRIAARLGFENAYALVVRSARPERSIGELGAASALVFGSDYEFFSRQEWAALRALYGLSPRETRTMDPSLLYEAVVAGAIDVVTGYTTDGRIEARDLRALADPRGAIPPYDALVLVSGRLATDRPELVQRLARLEGTIDVDLMRRLNHAVDSGTATPREAARTHPACRDRENAAGR